MKDSKKKQEKLSIPLAFDKAVSSFLTVKPEPKKQGPKKKTT